MSLPASYSSILSDLNRDVLRAQPTDALQFCANWFQTRLEQERSSARFTASFSASSTGVANMPSSASSGAAPSSRRSGQLAPSPSLRNRQVTPPSLVGQGYTFGGARGMDLDGDNKPLPFSEIPPVVPGAGGSFHSNRPGSNPPSPFSKVGERGLNSSTGPSSTPSTFHPAPLTFGGSALSSSMSAKRDSVGSNDSDDDDVYDPRDTSFGSGEGKLGIPVNYNLGRRSSVSAESLNPDPAAPMPKTVIPKSESQRQRIEASISNNLLFRNLDEDQHNDVLNAMKEVKVQDKTSVIVQGAVGDFFYVVEEGSFEAWVRSPPTHSYNGPGSSTMAQGEDKKVASYGPGGAFGELALMYNAPRAASVVATSDAVVWALDRVTFRSILMEHTSRKRKMYESFLAEVPILLSLNPKERAKIADALEEKVYEEGEPVVVEGEVGKNFYIIESGKAEVTKRRKSPSSGTFNDDVLGTLSKGDYFGELALLNSAPRAATVRAMAGQGRLRVATLGEKAFTRLLGPVLDILQRKAEHSYGPGATSGQHSQHDSFSATLGGSRGQTPGITA
ncbi:BQ5605_C016g08186 [Microbotryum silenes-dioicae]|uniref:cAMP-dependent protein kinase regulatory subunit n=1 Tax=Microbotryum silenes-dioicae TaxID=796604 RepID=A0A2X0NT51_9BASI|nr:BQ5605_C016g08186 [Microbotryum silenes-dioicae]